MTDLTTSWVNRAGQRTRRIARGQVTDSERLPVQVSQRLTRVPTILNKLLRANAAAIPNAGHRRLPCHFAEAGDRS